MAKYIAQLTGNTRINRTKILIIHIRPDSALGRDHCWVELTPALEKLAPKGHQKPRGIQFEADLKDYLRRGIEPSQTLTNLRNIKYFKIAK